MTLRTGGGALVAALQQHGVDTVFGIPGTHNLAVFSALAGTPIRTVLPRHEQGAGYAADGYARVRGRPGVCLTTTGPAILNAAAAAAQAWSDSVPVLFVSPGMPTDHPDRGNGSLHEVKNQQAALDAVVSHSHRVTSVDEIPHAVTLAFAEMTTGRPRPVHIEIPLDLLDATADVTPVAPVESTPPHPTAGPMRRAIEMLDAARKPVLIAGGGARHAADETRTLAERLGAPVLTTANGKGVLDEAHPLSVGAGMHHPSVRELLAESDAVLAFGTELAPSELWSGPLDLPGTLIRVDLDADAMTSNADPAVRVLADAAVALRGMAAELTPRQTGAGAERAATLRRRVQTDAAVEGARWTELMAALTPLVDERTVVAGDSAMVCYYGALSGLPVHRPAGFLYPAGLGTLGYALPAAIGACLADPDIRVLALLGDGGLMFTAPELAAAAQLRLPLPILVVDNGGYGEIHDEVTEREEPVHAVVLDTVDFPAMARAMGCHGVALSDPTDLDDALTAAFRADRPTLLHLREDGATPPPTDEERRAPRPCVPHSAAEREAAPTEAEHADGGQHAGEPQHDQNRSRRQRFGRKVRQMRVRRDVQQRVR